MNRRSYFPSLLAILVCLPALLQAQSGPVAQLWLTAPDRSALLALQPDPLRFTESSAGLPAVAVNDMQQFQPIEGFGFAVTGGSARLC